MQSESVVYDTIGREYAQYRRPDERIAAAIAAALGDARSVANIGAGTGSYEPSDRAVVAVEPSGIMIAQRPAGAAPAVQASAENLPLEDASFDACLAVLTMHHWTDWRAGVAEMLRVARRRVVVLTWDPEHQGFWLYRDYFPDALELDRIIFAPVREVARELGGAEVRILPVPHDCTDGFFGAYWRRPGAYLDDGVRSAISTFSRLPNVEARIDRLRRDLESGAWAERNGEIRALDELDTGYRLVVAQRTRCDGEGVPAP
ncbi:MAG TPA: class I SAM-dependent methyltransferase [Candidatus Kapabacteria bacterium]|nr:class I SAM-dependent methyltransferase [Candidatus Kapabacteria bacterium]